MNQDFYNADDLKLTSILDMASSNMRQGQSYIARPLIINIYNRITLNKRTLNELEDLDYKYKLGEACFNVLELNILEDSQSRRYTGLYCYLCLSHVIVEKPDFRQAYLVRILLLKSYQSLFQDLIHLLICKSENPFTVFSPVPEMSPESVINKMIRADLDSAPELGNRTPHFRELQKELDDEICGIYFDPKKVVPQAIEDGNSFHQTLLNHLDQEILGTIMLNYYFQETEDKHIFIADHFMTNGFGSDMPTLRYLSILNPKDRCIILEYLIREGIVNSILIDKLIMAYVKAGETTYAQNAIDYARANGDTEMNLWAYEQKLNMPIPKRMTKTERLELVESDRYGATLPIHFEFLDKIEFFLKYDEIKKNH